MPATLKRQTLLFLLLFLASLALVAAALPLLRLQPGLPVPYLSGGFLHVPGAQEDPPVDYAAGDFLVNIIIAILVIGFLWVIYRAISGVGWKALGRTLLRILAVTAGFAAFLAVAIYLMPTTQPVAEEIVVVPPPPPLVTSPLGAPPPYLTWLIGAGLALGAALLAVWIFRSRPSPGIARLRLAQEAEKARQALLEGLSLREVILQCYRQMSRVLQEEIGIVRQAYMTTGDFERLLAAEGFPAGPVHQLTSLFEAVRYGRWQPGLSDDQQAIACLEAIVQHSQETRQEVDQA